MIKEQEAGLPTVEVPQARIEPGDVLQAEGEVRRDEGIRRPSPTAARGRERQAQAALGRERDGLRHPQGTVGKRLTVPGQRRDAALSVMRDWPVSQRRACVLIGVDPKTVRRERPPEHAVSLKSIRNSASASRNMRFAIRERNAGLTPFLSDLAASTKIAGREAVAPADVGLRACLSPRDARWPRQSLKAAGTESHSPAPPVSPRRRYPSRCRGPAAS
jgi:hypothetical protein